MLLKKKGFYTSLYMHLFERFYLSKIYEKQNKYGFRRYIDIFD